MKSARITAARSWKKIVSSRPELSAITDVSLPGLTGGYNELQTLIKSQYVPMYSINTLVLLLKYCIHYKV